MLADLVLADLSDDVLVVLKEAIAGELKRRDAYAALKHYDVREETNEPISYEEWIAKTLISREGTEPCALPLSLRQMPLRKRIAYLPWVLAQDWTSYFPDVPDEETLFYVYAHLDPREVPLRVSASSIVFNGCPFYIGKGSGMRAWDLKRNQGHAKRIQVIRGLGYTETALVQIIAEGLTERQALSLEAKLIYFFGSIYDEVTDGCLLNLADHIKPIHKHVAIEDLPTRKSYRKDMTRRYKKIETGTGIQVRWEHWQQTSVSEKYLPVDARAMGYTVVRILPSMRGAFLDIMELLKVCGSLAHRPSGFPPDMQREWNAWQRWMQHLTGAMKNIVNGKADWSVET